MDPCDGHQRYHCFELLNTALESSYGMGFLIGISGTLYKKIHIIFPVLDPVYISWENRYPYKIYPKYVFGEKCNIRCVFLDRLHPPRVQQPCNNYPKYILWEQSWNIYPKYGDKCNMHSLIWSDISWETLGLNWLLTRRLNFEPIKYKIIGYI